MSKNVENRIAEPQVRAVLSPVQERLLGFIVSQCAETGSVRLSKNQLAKHLDCCVRTADNAVRGLRDAGFIQVTPLFDENGGQICNEYRMAGLVGGKCQLGRAS